MKPQPLKSVNNSYPGASPAVSLSDTPNPSLPAEEMSSSSASSISS